VKFVHADNDHGPRRADGGDFCSSGWFGGAFGCHQAQYEAPIRSRCDAADAVAGLKKSHGGNLVVFGSGLLVQSLLRRNLIDEFVLMIHPPVLGKGRGLFPEGVPDRRFRLEDSAVTAKGVIIATYIAAP
jgi:riboflavin biosynthesis pyrimidine reductase